jgi:hypothetical protein
MAANRSPSILRAAHGAGASAGLRAETPVLSELPPPNDDLARQGAAVVASRRRPFERGNTAAKGRKPALALLGLPIEGSDPRWCRALRRARSYLIRRRGELTVLCGGTLGAGPCAMLASAARALAASHVVFELAGLTSDPALFLMAAQLGDKSRQQELTAVALAEREAAARRAATPDDPVAKLRARFEAEEREEQALRSRHVTTEGDPE